MTNRENLGSERNTVLWGEGEYDIPVIIDKETLANLNIAGITKKDIFKRRIGNKLVDVIYVKGSKEMYDSVMNSYYSEIKKEERDGRCNISNGKGKLIRCPEQIKNPETGEMMTNSCKNCPYHNQLDKKIFRTMTYSDLAYENEEGDVELLEARTDCLQDEGERYERILKGMLDYLNGLDPMYGDIISMAEQGAGQTEIGKRINKSQASVNAYLKKIKPIVEEFMDNIIF